MLTERLVVEQRSLAIKEVLDGVRVTDVATRYYAAFDHGDLVWKVELRNEDGCPVGTPLPSTWSQLGPTSHPLCPAGCLAS